MKIWDIVKEDFEGPDELEEGWKNNVLATVIGVSSLLGSAKGQSGLPNTNGVNVSQQANKDSLRLDISKLFKSGQYVFHAQDDAYLKEELRKFGSEIVKNSTSDFLIEIVSSESRVTNYDMEPTSPTYKQKLDVGGLAQKRAGTVNFILTNFANELKKDGTLKGQVKFTQPKILIGDVPWPSVDPKTGVNRTNADPVYTKDQFIYVNIKIVNKQVQNQDPYNVFADNGEEVHFNQHTVAIVFYPTRSSNNAANAGNTNTAYENILLKTVKPNTPLTGKKNDKGVYLKDYVIPWQWWNANVSNRNLSQDNIDYITKNFEAR